MIKSRSFCIALLLIVFAHVAPAHGQTADDDKNKFPPSNQAADITSGIALVGSIVFFSADMIYLAEWSWLPPVWAWSQLAMSTMNLGVGIWQSADSNEGSVGLGIAHFVLAATFAAHGIASLLLYNEPLASTSDDLNVAHSLSLPSFVPLQGGGMAAFAGTF